MPGKHPVSDQDQPAARVSGEREGGQERAGITVVGIGASAGGLEAFTQLLENLPPDTGMAFVLVQHLDPHHESILADLLSRTTAMPVTQAVDGEVVLPDHVYVIPPDRNMAILHGALTLMPRPEGARNLPIDYFFRSLAEDQGAASVGVVLSGTGSDGAGGLRAISGEGGVTLVQSPESAGQDGMPQSAIAAGVADFVLPPAGIAAELTRISRHPYASVQRPPAELVSDSSGLIDRILLAVRELTHVDFAYYKRNTVERRIARRMLLEHIDTLGAYLDHIGSNTAEADALMQDILIGVTRFFRDPDAFETLREQVVPKLLEDRSPDDAMRVWVPGCSTGEEAYSIAILLSEALDGLPSAPRIQVFASDINDRAIDKARAGFYPDSIAEDVSAERLRRYFRQEPGGYRIDKRVREVCVFARHDITRDPPFSRLDLVSLRNVLIYMEAALQQRVIPSMHYALRPGGFLFLGSSESIGRFSELFAPVDKKQRVYVRKAGPSNVRLGVPPTGFVTTPATTPVTRPRLRGAFDWQGEADRIVVSRYSPAGVVVDCDLRIQQFRGHTAPFLELPSGRASFDLLGMAKEGLALDLRTAVHQSQSENVTVRKRGLRVRDGDQERLVDIEVVPLSKRPDCYSLVLFRESTPTEAPGPAVVGSAAKGDAEGAENAGERRDREDVRRELNETRSRLQEIIEARERSNEELMAANEEIQSSNEELQSINEELETAKEELQSSNEELNTLNQELQNRNTELGETSDDLTNLLTSVNIAIVMLTDDLRVRRVTPLAETVLNVRAADAGRRLSDIRLRVDVPDLEQAIAEVIDAVSPIEREVKAENGRWYSLRIRPYKTSDARISGAVMSLIDIDDLKRTERAIAAARDYAEAVVETVARPLVVLDSELRVVSVNSAYHRMFDTEPGAMLGRALQEIDGRRWDQPGILALLRDAVSEHSAFRDVRVEQATDGGARRTLRVSGTPIVGTSEETPLVLLAIEDVTERERAEQELRRAKDLSDSLNAVNAAIASTLETAEIMRTVVISTSEALGATAAYIELHEEDCWVTRYAFGLPDTVIGARSCVDGSTASDEAVRSRQPVVIDDVREDDGVPLRMLPDGEIRSAMVVPLVFKGVVAGTLTFEFAPEVVLTAAHVEFAERLAGAVSLALENARLFEAEHRIAEVLQQNLVHRIPEIPGLDIGIAYESAVQAERVGGDFFDVFPLDERRVVVLIGDVAGKGIEAAGLTETVRSSVRAVILIDPSPALAFRRVNDALLRELRPGQFITAILMVIDLETREVTFTRAGHTLPIHCSQECVLVQTPPDLPLGVSETDFAEHTMHLGASESLVLYTDGLTEARREGELFGEERALSVAIDLRSHAAQPIAQGMLAAAGEWAGRKLADDINIVVVRMVGPASHG